MTNMEPISLMGFLVPLAPDAVRKQPDPVSHLNQKQTVKLLLCCIIVGVISGVLAF